MMVHTFSRSEKLVELPKALAKAQAELKNPPKDRVNPHYRSKYADLATVRDTVLPVLNKYGLSVVQLPCELPASEGSASRMGLWTLLLHESGEYLGACMPLLLVKNDPQGFGSALTYARRYALQALVGVAADEDDDGEVSSPKEHSRQEKAVSTGKVETRTLVALVKAFQAHGVSAEQLVSKFGKTALESLTPAEIEALRSIYKKISRGEPVETHFPRKQAATGGK